MKTVVIRVEELSAASKGYPVSLHFDDGKARWLEVDRALATSVIPEDLAITNPPLDPADDVTPLDGQTLREMFLAQKDGSERFQVIGEYLYRLLFQDKVKTSWDALGHDYPGERPDESEGRRTILDIKPQKLRLLPWELMSSDSSPLPLFVNALNPMVRGSLNLAAPAVCYMWPIHVLIVVGSEAIAPGEEDEIKAEEEVSTIEDALIKFGRPVEWEVLRRPTNQQLKDRLKTFQPHIFHFIGHGRKALGGRVPVLAFEEGENGPAWEWTARKIGIDLNQVWVPRFAFINACRSSDGEESEKVWAITDAFISAGVPAVVGMQADIQGEAAASFPGQLYEALARNTPLDEALAAARSDVMNVTKDGLERRDWALATFFLSVLPSQVLPMQPQVTTQFKLGIEAQFSRISEFVDRVGPRRTLWYGVEPLMKTEVAKNLLMVKGAELAGKTWLVYWCLKICAWRERNIMYVSLQSQTTKDFLQVLRQIRDVCVSGQPIGRPVDPSAFYEFNRVVNHVLDPAEPAPGSVGPGVQAVDKDLPLRDIDDDSIKSILSAFRAALGKAAGNQPLVIALDDLKIREDHFIKYLVPFLIEKIAAGQEDAIKNIRMILVARPTDYDTVYNLGDLENLAVTVRLDLLSKSEQTYFSRELCILNGYSREEANSFSSFVGTFDNTTASPEDVRTLFTAFKRMNKRGG